MFWNKPTPNTDKLSKQMADMRIQLDNLISERDQLASERDQLASERDQMLAEKAAIESQTRVEPMSVDFDGMRAFSIERLDRSGEPVTLIGYWITVDGNSTVGEWLLHCSSETHGSLVERFEYYLKNKPHKK